MSVLPKMAYPPDLASSSIFSDNINPLLPSDSFSFDLSELTEPTESQLTEPNITQLPLSVQRVGDRTKDWALWTEMTKTEFIE